MATTRQGGAGILLPPQFPAYNRLTSQFSQVGAGPLALAAGGTFKIPAGQFLVKPGSYSFIRVKDPTTGTWRVVSPNGNSTPHFVLSDGENFQLVNLSGCAAGAYVTNVGSAYTSAPAVTASAGGSAWTAIVGGAINSTVTITSAGSGFSYPPTLVIDSPGPGGVQATAICALTAGVISSVTVIDQGAGYTRVPAITVIPDPRDTAGSGGVLTAALTGSGTITAVICTDHGTPLTSVPTLSFSGGGGSSAAATVVMCFTLTGYTVGTAGVAYGNAQPILTLAVGGIVGGAAGATVNPAIGPGLFTPRNGQINSTSTAGGALTTGGTIQDGGIFQAVPVSVTLAGNATPTTQAVAALTVGGVTDTSYLYPV